MSLAERKPYCRSGKCSGPATAGMTQPMTEKYSGGAAMGSLQMTAPAKH